MALLLDSLDPTKSNRVSYSMMRDAFEERCGRSEGAAAEPALELAVSAKTSNVELEAVRATARKMLNGKVNVLELVRSKDKSGDGILSRDELSQVLNSQSFGGTTSEDVQRVVTWADAPNRGWIAIDRFCARLQELSSVSKMDAVLRGFADQLNRHRIDLGELLSRGDTKKTGKLSAQQFKRALQSVKGVSEEDLKTLSEAAQAAGEPNVADIKLFMSRVAQSRQQKIVPFSGGKDMSKTDTSQKSKPSAS